MKNPPSRTARVKRSKKQQAARGGLRLVHSVADSGAPSVGRGRAAELRQMLVELADMGPSSLDRAQDLIYDAWEASASKRRVALARKALAISADCADAYVLLAEETDDDTDARRLLEQGVAAGERALGEEFFRENAGDFWGLLETRPYMRARQALAQLLWAEGERDAAVGHYQELLRLNPNDNQGIRDLVVPCLLELGREEAAASILAAYGRDESAWMSFSRALLAFRRGGDCAQSRKLLLTALRCNPHVRSYLLGRRRLPRFTPDYYSPGEESEAVCYVMNGARSWASVPGAIAWLAGFE
jgi:tetratricopeptide (TPR) repeat protein